jgi:hypothetical protein
MKRIITGRKMGLLAGTRVALGIGIGLLLARRLSHRKGAVLGIALTGAGALSTIPIAIAIGRSPSVRDRKSAA